MCVWQVRLNIKEESVLDQDSVRHKLGSWTSAVSALGLPWLFSCLIYIVIAVIFMPIRYQLGFRPNPIFQNGGVAWVDLVAALVLGFGLCLPALLRARQAAALLGRSPLNIISAVALTPTYTFIGRWFWEPAAGGSMDASTGGSSAGARVFTIGSLVLFTVFIHALLAGAAAITFMLPVWLTALVGHPSTMPCIAIELMGSPGGLIRVKCDPMPPGRLYDSDALEFFVALFAIWAVTSTLQGFIAFSKTGKTAARYR